MLGQHLVRQDVVALLQGALHHHPLPLAEQVRQYPLIAHRHRPFGVVEAEVHLQRIRVAPDAAGHHHPADAQALARRRQLLRLALAVEDFAGGIEQVDIRAQRVQDQGGGQRQARQHRADHP
ncbi:hypothetical protein NGUA26_04034 [Salmonella enterica]|nr:hypothetical protein NGUA26_04034 [Salmonella enterica]